MEKHWDVYALYVYFLLFFVVNVFLYVFNFILEDFFFLSLWIFFFFPTKKMATFFFWNQQNLLEEKILVCKLDFY